VGEGCTISVDSCGVTAGASEGEGDGGIGRQALANASMIIPANIMICLNLIGRLDNFVSNPGNIFPTSLATTYSRF
jgi:hypothetical protein